MNRTAAHLQRSLGHLPLANATSYFATSTIGMKEWFDPISQVFLACIVKQKYQLSGFNDMRVLLFFGMREIGDLNAPYLDGYYARRLADLHIHYGTPLAFLNREEIFSALSKLSFDEMKMLGCYPRWLRWLPDWLLKHISLNRMHIRIPELDFAVVEGEDKAMSVLLVSKCGESVHVSRVTESTHVSAYMKFVENINQFIFKGGKRGAQIDEKHDFIKFFNPFASPGQSAALRVPSSSPGPPKPTVPKEEPH